MGASRSDKLRDFISELKSKLRLSKPTIAVEDGMILYIPAPAALEQKHAFKLDLTFQYFHYRLNLN
jgi:hypothetical protein